VLGDRLTPSLPAHVTLLVPFVAADELTDDVEKRLAGVLATAQPFEVTFTRTARFSTTLYLAPEPAAPFVRLTELLCASWPEHPPYGGQFDSIVPHLTVAESEDQSLLDRIEAEVEPRLPLAAHVREAQLYEEGADGRWRERRRFPLGPS
jgi:2'-5' RNA ligase